MTSPTLPATASARAAIENGATALGIELGSTRIKAVLVDATGATLATGGFSWENRLVDGAWSYALDDVAAGVRAAYAELAAAVERDHGLPLERLGAVGVSAMMHGYLAFDADGELLVPFRTWRNTTTAAASERLTEALGVHIPQRWSAAHAYQAALDGEPHVAAVAHLTTLAGYVHEALTGRRVLGVGDASGMFPLAADGAGYDAERLAAYDRLAADAGIARPLADVLPDVLPAGGDAGELTEQGARWLDPSGVLRPGALAAPPEGDAGTGMVATNAIAPRTGNVSAGTSIFAMVVLERPLRALHTELDLVATPAGDPVAMVHVNNCSSDLNAWAGVFAEFAAASGASLSPDELWAVLYGQALAGEPDAGGLLAYNYLSGEHQTGFEEGRPLLARGPQARLTLPNLMRAHLSSAFAALRLGMDVLAGEDVALEGLFAHGGLFKTAGAAQRLLAGALRVPVTVGDTAGEGGAWGMAVLAGFRLWGGTRTLADYLDEAVFAGAEALTVAPDADDAAGFDAFLARYTAGFPIERAAITHL